jgi:hypothetical protein
MPNNLALIHEAPNLEIAQRLKQFAELGFIPVYAAPMLQIVSPNNRIQFRYDDHKYVYAHPCGMLWIMTVDRGRVQKSSVHFNWIPSPGWGSNPGWGPVPGIAMSDEYAGIWYQGYTLLMIPDLDFNKTLRWVRSISVYGNFANPWFFTDISIHERRSLTDIPAWVSRMILENTGE